MCRWITLLSTRTVSLSDVVLAPSNSLVQMSRDATFHPGYEEINNAALNADGFGVGWYHTNVAICPAPCNSGGHHDGSIPTHQEISNGGGGPSISLSSSLHYGNGYGDELTETKAAIYKDVFPAWNNINLREICMSTRSNCVVAHVRAASKGTGISYNNCHPFKAGRLMFCHNGRIFEFSKVRRRFISCISDESFDNIKGTTDSEVIFALVLTHLANDGYGVSPFEQKTPFGHKRLTAALKKSLRQIETLLEEARHTDGYSTCNFSLTDGDTMVVTRYCDQAPEIPPPSLYFAFGDAMTLYKELTQETVDASQLAALPHILSSIELSKSVHSTDSSSVGSGGGDFDEKPLYLFNAESKPGRIMADVDPAKASFIVSSNPLTKTHTWHPMPRNSIMWCTRGSHPELRLLRRTKSLMQPPPVFD